MNFTTSRQLQKNVKGFLNINLFNIFSKKRDAVFYGWGRKKSGQKAISLAKKYNTSFVLLEDGFIRSIALGVDNAPSFSIVEDDKGIYYDATVESRLENILNTYDFHSDILLMQKTKEAINLIKEYHISKYNHAPEMDESFFSHDEKRVLVIAQTARDSSLKYGMLKDFTTDEMIRSAIDENPNSIIYLKIHPDVLSGKKSSDIDIKILPKSIKIIKEDINPISLLKYFKKVYTKTSGMGFESLLVGCECICFGMPYYAGWGITTDKVKCQRRKRTLSVEEVFAGAYILYTRYYNPFKKRKSDILDTINEIILQTKGFKNID